MKVSCVQQRVVHALLVFALLMTPVACESGNWTAIAEALEAGNGGLAQNATHNDFHSVAKVRGHVPRLSFDDRSAVTVHVEHGMSVDHFIDVLYIRNQAGQVVYLQRFAPTSPTCPTREKHRAGTYGAKCG